MGARGVGGTGRHCCKAAGRGARRGDKGAPSVSPVIFQNALTQSGAEVYTLGSSSETWRADCVVFLNATLGLCMQMLWMCFPVL